MLRPALLAASLAFAGAALACGYCVEDKIASVYDHAVVTQAVGGGQHVAFFHVEGPVAKDEATRRALVSAVDSQPGIDRKSVRVALETLTVSFAFDPRRTSLIKAQNAVDKKLAARQLSLFPMRVIERAAELKEISRR